MFTGPVIVHVIWIGGDMPENRFQNVLNIRKFQPENPVWFWSDSRWRDPRRKIENGFAKLAGALRGTGIELKDVSEHENILTDHYRTEAGYLPRNRTLGPLSQWANFGTASDLLRYHILFRHGGLYADTDLELTGRTSLSYEDLNRRIDGGPIGLLLHDRGRPDVAANDLIVSPERAVLFRGLIPYCQDQLDKLYRDPQRVLEYESTKGGVQSNRAIETQLTTGPEAVRNFIRDGFGLEIRLRGAIQFWKDASLRLPELKLEGVGSGSEQLWLKE